MDANGPEGTDAAETPAESMTRTADSRVSDHELNSTALPASHDPRDTTGRRRFLKWFGVSASGVALANTIDSSKEKIEAGGERAQEEIAKLKKELSMEQGNAKELMKDRNELLAQVDRLNRTIAESKQQVKQG